MVGTTTANGASKLQVDAGTTNNANAGTFRNDSTSAYATTDGGINTALSISSTGTNAAQAVGIQFSLTKTGETGAISEIGAIREGNGLSGLVFRTRDAATGRNERLRIDSSGRVGIGTSSPTTKLEVHDGSGTSAQVVKINSGGVGLLSIQSGTNTDSRIEFGDSANDDAGYIYYENDNEVMRFGVNANERMRIDSSGNVGIGVTSVSSSRRVEIKQPSSYSAAVRILADGNGNDGDIEWFSGLSQYGLGVTQGTDAIRLRRDNAELMRLASAGQIGLGGANYGTSGQVITSNGSGSAPTWQDAGGGAWNLISTVNASGASTVNLTGIDNTYSSYAIKMTDATIVPGSSGRFIYCQFLISNSVSSSSGFYANRQEYSADYDMNDDLDGSQGNPSLSGQQACIGLKAPGNNYFTKYNGAPYCELTNEIGQAANKISMEMVLMNPGVSYGSHAFWWHALTNEEGWASSRTKFRHCDGNGLHYVNTSSPNSTSGSAISGVRFTVNRNDNSAGTITGKFQLYGIS